MRNNSKRVEEETDYNIGMHKFIKSTIIDYLKTLLIKLTDQ